MYSRFLYPLFFSSQFSFHNIIRDGKCIVLFSNICWFVWSFCTLQDFCDLRGQEGKEGNEKTYMGESFIMVEVYSNRFLFCWQCFGFAALWEYRWGGLAAAAGWKRPTCWEEISFLGLVMLEFCALDEKGRKKGKRRDRGVARRYVCKPSSASQTSSCPRKTLVSALYCVLTTLRRLCRLIFLRERQYLD